MKYFSIETSTQFYIGDDTQLFGLHNNEINKLFIGKSFPELEKGTLKFELNRKAQLTNFLSQSNIASSGFIVDDIVKSLFEKFNIMRHKYYPVSIFKENNDSQIDVNYYWMQLNEDLTTEIDFKNSIFSETMFSCEEGNIQLNSFEHFKKLKESKGIFWGVEAAKIQLIEGSKLYKHDMVCFHPFSNKILVSKRLEQAIRDAKISGIDLETTKLLFG